MNKKTLTGIGTGLALVGTLVIGATLFKSEIPLSGTTTLSEIEQLEEAYFAKTGTYLQILLNNKLSTDKEGSVENELGKDIPSNYKVDVYGGGKGGEGYRIYWDDTDFNYVKEKDEEEVRTAKPAPVIITSTST